MRFEFPDRHKDMEGLGFLDAGGRALQSFRVLFIFSDAELISDIGQTAFAQGDVARVMDNYGHDHLANDREHTMHQWLDITQGDNLIRVRKSINLAISKVEHILFRWAKYDGHRHNISLDNIPKEKAEYVIELRVPDQFSDATADYLIKLIHEYIVDYVLYDWATLTYPEAAATWFQKMGDNEKEIRKCSHLSNVYHKVLPTII